MNHEVEESSLYQEMYNNKRYKCRNPQYKKFVHKAVPHMSTVLNSIQIKSLPAKYKLSSTGVLKHLLLILCMIKEIWTNVIC